MKVINLSAKNSNTSETDKESSKYTPNFRADSCSQRRKTINTGS